MIVLEDKHGTSCLSLCFIIIPVRFIIPHILTLVDMMTLTQLV